jgi:hypothetical protein
MNEKNDQGHKEDNPKGLQEIALYMKDIVKTLETVPHGKVLPQPWEGAKPKFERW